MPTYPPGYAGPIPATPLDPDSVVWYDFDFQPDNVKAPGNPMLAVGETIAEAEITVGAGLAAGDGVTPVTGKAGAVTPPAPDATLNGATTARVWLYVDGATVGSTVIVECTVRTSLDRRISRSISILVADR